MWVWQLIPGRPLPPASPGVFPCGQPVPIAAVAQTTWTTQKSRWEKVPWSSSVRPSLWEDSSPFVLLPVATLSLWGNVLRPPATASQLDIALGPSFPSLMDAHTGQYQEHRMPGTYPVYVCSHLVTHPHQKQTWVLSQLERFPELVLRRSPPHLPQKALDQHVVRLPVLRFPFLPPAPNPAHGVDQNRSVFSLQVRSHNLTFDTSSVASPRRPALWWSGLTKHQLLPELIRNITAPCNDKLLPEQVCFNNVEKSALINDLHFS